MTSATVLMTKVKTSLQVWMQKNLTFSEQFERLY